MKSRKLSPRNTYMSLQGGQTVSTLSKPKKMAAATYGISK